MFLCNRNLLELLDIFLILLQATNYRRMWWILVFHFDTYLFTQVQVYLLLCRYTDGCLPRWIKPRIAMIFQRGNGGFARSAANWTNWEVNLRNVEGHGREEKTRCICRRGVDPGGRTYATSHSEWSNRGVSNLPMIVYGLTSITSSDRRYSLCGPRPYAIVKWHNVSFSLTSHK